MTDLHQQLWELVYGLLSEDEARALSERITSDPYVARAYAKVKLQSELVADAARYEDGEPSASWYEAAPSAGKTPEPAAHARGPARSRIAQAANWMVGLAAAGLVAVLGSSWWTTATPPTREAVSFAMTAPIRTILTGPSLLHAEANSPFTVQTTSLTGAPVSTSVRYRVLDQAGAVAYEESNLTDQRGTVRFELPNSLNARAARLEVTADEARMVPVSRPLQVSERKFVTYLRLDRPRYQPGERVFYRSVTLSRFGLQATEEVDVEFQLLDSDNRELTGSRQVVWTRQGVASGQFELPMDLAGGKYTLLARSTTGKFSDEWRELTVQPFTVPRWKKKLELLRDSYAVGEEVEADLLVEKAEGGAVAQAPLQIEAHVDGQKYAIPAASTNEDGAYRLRFRLPETIAAGQASVAVTVTDAEGNAETISEEIPINLGRLNVDFFPEGGELVGELPNRVYFHGRDPLGKPVHIEGRIVDDSQAAVTPVATQHEGRGVFSLTPAPGRQYRLMVDTPPSVTKEIPLPAVSTQRSITLDSQEGVFPPQSPLRWTIHARDPLVPLVLAAYCRGAMVGQVTVQPSDYRQTALGQWTLAGELPLAENAQGVLRLTVFDLASQPPQPVAERLVFRRIEKKLSIDLTSNQESFAPGEQVALKLRVKTEGGSPTAATLGISVVDDAVLSLADDKSVRMPTYFHLLTEIENPTDLEDANFYLSDAEGAAQALDLLLGTQGWRRFVEVPWSALARADRATGLGASGLGHVRQWTLERPDLPVELALGDDVVPLVNDNLAQVENQQSTAIAPESVSPLKTATWPGFVWLGGVLLLVLVAGIALMDIALKWKAMAITAVLALTGLRLLPSLYSVHRPANEHAVATGAASFSDESAEAKSIVADAAAPQMGLESAMVEANALPSPASSMPAPVELARGATPPAAEGPAPKETAPLSAAAATAPELALAEKKDAPPAPEPPREPPAARQADPAETVPPPPPATPPAVRELAAAAVDQAGAIRSRMLKKLEVQDQVTGAPQPEIVLLREYGAQFGAGGFGRSSGASSSATLFWQPLFSADTNGEASIRFSLPDATTAYRAIVEAHGLSRLGSGEMLIVAQPPSE